MFFPVTVQCPFHSLMEKGDLIALTALPTASFGECPPLVPVFWMLRFTFCCFFGKCLLHMYRHKNVYNLGVESYVLFSKNLLVLQKCRQHLKVRNLAFFMSGKMQESSRWNHPLWYTPHHLEPVSCPPSQVSSGIIVGSGCSLMAAKEQVFSFPSFFRAHQEKWLQPDGF